MWVEKLDLSIYSNGTKRDGKIFEYNSKGKQIGIYNTTKEIANKRNITIGEINRAIQGEYKIKNNYYSLQDVKTFIPKVNNIDIIHRTVQTMEAIFLISWIVYDNPKIPLA